MKTYFKSSFLLFVAVLSVALLDSCKPKEADPVRIQSVVSQDIIDQLESRGMRIHQGNHPPKLDLSVIIAPFELLAPFGEEDTWQKGKIIGDYFYKFYGQTNSQEITYDYYQEGKNSEGKGEGAFIIGADNRFTIFSEEIGTSYGIPNKKVTIISGVLEGSEIKNFQYAFVLTEKTGDDDNSNLMPVGKSRIWIDKDGLSESISNFRRSSEGSNAHSGSAASVR